MNRYRSVIHVTTTTADYQEQRNSAQGGSLTCSQSVWTMLIGFRLFLHRPSRLFFLRYSASQTPVRHPKLSGHRCRFQPGCIVAQRVGRLSEQKERSCQYLPTSPARKRQKRSRQKRRKENDRGREARTLHLACRCSVHSRLHDRYSAQIYSAPVFAFG
jgi:hypothetical protein